MIDPKKLAEEICSVQPMPNDVFSKIYEESKSEKDLLEEGYTPVSSLGLLWTKE